MSHRHGTLTSDLQTKRPNPIQPRAITTSRGRQNIQIATRDDQVDVGATIPGIATRARARPMHAKPARITGDFRLHDQTAANPADHIQIKHAA